jgi:cytochrome c5
MSGHNPIAQHNLTLIIMQILELAPLLEKVEVLKGIAGAEDVYVFVHANVMAAITPAMGQSVCEEVITMCHPRAWGDRQVPNFGKTWADWGHYLSELQEVAASCGQRIYERYAQHD